jgi:hypothetical protein
MTLQMMQLHPTLNISYAGPAECGARRGKKEKGTQKELTRAAAKDPS